MEITFDDRFALVLTEIKEKLDATGEMTGQDVDAIVQRWSLTDFDSVDDDETDIGLEDYNMLLGRVNHWVMHQVMSGAFNDVTDDDDA